MALLSYSLKFILLSVSGIPGAKTVLFNLKKCKNVIKYKIAVAMATGMKIKRIYAFLFITRQKLKTGKVSGKSIFFFSISSRFWRLQRMTLKLCVQFMFTTLCTQTNVWITKHLNTVELFQVQNIYVCMHLMNSTYLILYATAVGYQITKIKTKEIKKDYHSVGAYESQ